MKYTDIMLDLETFSSDPDAAIVSIGAVAFDRTASLDHLDGSQEDLLESGQGFYVNVDLENTPEHERGSLSPSTIRWWMGQSEEARNALFEGPRFNLVLALKELNSWIYRTNPKANLWSNGPTFDEVIIRAAARRCELPFNIHYRNSRCFRTVTDLARGTGWEGEKSSDDLVAHDALADAIRQARLTVSAVTHLSTPQPR